MKTRFFALLLAFALLFGLTSSASAQTYYFEMERLVADVYITDQGVMQVVYAITFANSPSADAIEFVDVGLPNADYDFGSITANVDGNPVSVGKDYQGDGCCGVAVELGPYAIPPGERGTVYITVARIDRMVYPDDQDDTYASFEFAPVYFGSEYVYGTTDLTVAFHLPPGVLPEEPRWHGAPSGFPSEPQTGLDEEGRVLYSWNNPSALGDTQYTFGASFPAKYVPESAIVRISAFELFLGSVFAVLGTIVEFFPVICFGLFFFGIPALSAVQSSRRKLEYLPPKIAIEGHGIKRGLTAVEAAILMAQPLDKVMTMILFGVIKKSAAQVEKKNPLELSFSNPVPEGLREYESDFLAAFKETDIKKRRRALQSMTVSLVRAVTEKMKGFSRKETMDYYKTINEKAWVQIQAAGTPEVQRQTFEEAMEWTMLDKDYDDRARRTFTGPIFVPTWWGRYDPVYRSAPMSMPTLGSSGGSGGRSALPGADFAASVVGGVQTFASGVIGNVSEFTGGVTNVTNPPPPPSTSSGGSRGSGGGGGCACACACAGCACACAGGGR